MGIAVIIWGPLDKTPGVLYWIYIYLYIPEVGSFLDARSEAMHHGVPQWTVDGTTCSLVIRHSPVHKQADRQTIKAYVVYKATTSCGSGSDSGSDSLGPFLVWGRGAGKLDPE